MSLRKISFVCGEYHHVYNRGNSKQTIFHDKADYHRFVKLLFLANGNVNFKIDFIENEIYDFDRGEPLVDIGAYCLMPNHFHILLTQTSSGNVSKFMQKLSTGYSMYYNNKYNRTGTLFEGKFKSEHVKDDRHLKYLFSYIHLNPVKLIDSHWKERGIRDKNQALRYLEKYSFSSYMDYLDPVRREREILSTSAFPNYFSKKNSFEKDIFDWLTYSESYRQDL